MQLCLSNCEKYRFVDQCEPGTEGIKSCGIFVNQY